MPFRMGRNSEPCHGSYSTSCKYYAGGEGTVSQFTALTLPLANVMQEERNSEPGHGSYSTSCKYYAGGEGTVSQVTAPTAHPANVMQEGNVQ
jgi:hypothetical protein